MAAGKTPHKSTPGLILRFHGLNIHNISVIHDDNAQMMFLYKKLQCNAILNIRQHTTGFQGVLIKCAQIVRV